MPQRIVLLVVVLATLPACGSSYEGERERSRTVSAPAPTGGFGPQQLTPQAGQATVVETAAGSATTGSCWTTPALREHRLPGAGKPGEVAAAADGAVWFTDADDGSIGRLEPAGALRRYRLPAGRAPGSLAVAGDGSVWFTTTGLAIAHLTRTATSWDTPCRPSPRCVGASPAGLARSALATTAPSGSSTPMPTRSAASRSTGPSPTTRCPVESVGMCIPKPSPPVPNGAMWFSEPLAGRLGRIDVETFAMTEFPIPPDHTGVPVGSVAAGPHRTVWFDGGTGLGRITTRGDARWFPLPEGGRYGPTSVMAGPDGQIWTIDRGNGKVMRLTPDGQASELPPVADPASLTKAGLRQLTAGPDAVWFSEPGLNRIGRYACAGA